MPDTTVVNEGSPTAAPDGPSTVVPALEHEGDSIGPYHLLQVVGEGGFGVVWLAERRGAFTQRVALKMLKPGMDSRAVIARFEQERQALAVMDHPNVAKVLDGGLTPMGRPYFVMEYVQGEPITGYCDRHRLTVEQRLELFTLVCEAVQHAHTKGIIHRDLKPSNILVSISDSRPVPKVIDFGVAKAVVGTMTEKTVFTEQGQLIGTPEYMSPEQAEMGALDIDTRTDVYSLGVVLYQLIAGVLPFDSGTLRAAGYDAIRRIIREQDAPKPSTRLSSIDDKEATDIAHTRQRRREELTGQLRRELEWIPLKALRKHRTERYGSAADLARDIRRYLNKETLEAGPESAAYRLRKLVKRHRGPVAAGSLIVLTLLVGAAASTAGFVRASMKAKEARREFLAAREAEGVARAAEGAAKKSEAAAVESLRESRLSAYSANIALARSAIDTRDLTAAREALGACPDDLRGWEWSLLESATSSSLGGFTAHGGRICSLAYSPDGSKLATCSADGTARIWEHGSGDLLADLDTARSPVNGIAWNPEGTQVVTATGDGRLRTWTVQGRLLAGTPYDEDQPTFVTWSPTGGHIAALRLSGRATVVDAQSLSVVHTLSAHDGLPAQACFALDGSRLFTSGWNDHRVKCFDVASGEQLASFDTGTNITTLVAATKAPVVAGANFWWPFTFDLAKPVRAEALKDAAREADALMMSLSPDGRTLLTGGRTTISVYNLERRELVHHKPVEYTWWPTVAIHPSGEFVARGDDRGRVRFWRVDTPYSFPLRKHRVSRVTFNDRVIAMALNAGRIAYGQVDGAVELVNLDDPDRRTVIPPRQGKILGIACTPDGSRLVTAGADRTVLVRTAPFTDTAVEHSVGGEPGAVAVSSDGAVISVGRRDGGVEVIGGGSGSPRVLEGHTGPVQAVAISPDGRRLVSAGYDNTVRLWDLGTWRPLASAMPHARLVMDLAFSPDGSAIAAASMDSTATLLEAGSLKVRHTLRGHTREVTSVSFSGDGRRVSTSSWDGTVRLWSTATGAEAYRLQAVGAHRFAFAPDGSRFAGVGSGNIFDWQAVPLHRRLAAAQLGGARSDLDAGVGLHRAYERMGEGPGADGSAGRLRFEIVQTMQMIFSEEARDAAAETLAKDFATDEEAEAAVAGLDRLSTLRPHIRSRAVRLARDTLLAPAVRLERLRAQLLRKGPGASADAAGLRARAESLYTASPLVEHLVLRGIARFRAGAAGEAVADLNEAIRRRREMAPSIIDVELAERQRDRPVELAFLAMALNASGRPSEASEHYGRLQRAMLTVPDTDVASRSAYKEARGVFEGK